MEVVYRCCCGIDVHKKLIVACLRKGGRQELREYGTMTPDIKELANWLTEAGCEMTAMESTGVYCIRRPKTTPVPARSYTVTAKNLHLRRGSDS